MIVLFFPAMTVLATSHIFAAISILCDECASSPVLAEMLMIIAKHIWLSSKVLPVMTVHTLRLVVIIIERTELGLIVVHIEVCVLCHLMNDPLLQLLGAMGERAVVSILTLRQVLWILGAVLGLVLLWMVDTFHSVVAHVALVLLLTQIGLIIVT